MLIMGVGSGRRGEPWLTLDFHTWYRYRDLIVLFFGLFCYFSVLYRCPPSANFSADALDADFNRELKIQSLYSQINFIIL